MDDHFAIEVLKVLETYIRFHYYQIQCFLWTKYLTPLRRRLSNKVNCLKTYVYNAIPKAIHQNNNNH